MTFTAIRHTYSRKGELLSRETVGTKEIDVSDDALFEALSIVFTGMRPDRLADEIEAARKAGKLRD